MRTGCEQGAQAAYQVSGALSRSVISTGFTYGAAASSAGRSTSMSCPAGVNGLKGGTVGMADQRMSHQSEPVRARLRGRRSGLLCQPDRAPERGGRAWH